MRKAEGGKGSRRLCGKTWPRRSAALQPKQSLYSGVLIGIDAVAGIAQEFGLKGLGQGGVAGGEIFLGRLKIVPPAPEIFFDDFTAANPGVVPRAGTEAVKADALVHVVRGSDVEATVAGVLPAAGVLGGKVGLLQNFGIELQNIDPAPVNESGFAGSGGWTGRHGG